MKTTPEIRNRIRWYLYLSNYTQVEIARRIGCSTVTVANIKAQYGPSHRRKSISVAEAFSL